MSARGVRLRLRELRFAFEVAGNGLLQLRVSPEHPGASAVRVEGCLGLEGGGHLASRHRTLASRGCLRLRPRRVREMRLLGRADGTHVLVPVHESSFVPTLRQGIGRANRAERPPPARPPNGQGSKP